MILVLLAMIVFNKKRSGEAARILVTDFKKGFATSSRFDSEVLQGLSYEEKKVATRYKQVKFRGKSGNTVAALFDKELIAAINRLMIFRTGIYHSSTPTEYFSLCQVELMR